MNTKDFPSIRQLEAVVTAVQFTVSSHPTNMEKSERGYEMTSTIPTVPIVSWSQSDSE